MTRLADIDILAPVAAGVIAGSFGNIAACAGLGVMGFLVALLLLAFMPSKVRLRGMRK